MILLTRQTRANTAADKWTQQYRNYTGDYLLGSFDKKSADDIRTALESLGPTPNPDDVDAAIGNDSWTDIHQCHECGRCGLPVLVQLGEELDCESSTANICLDCLVKAVALVAGDTEERG